VITSLEKIRPLFGQFPDLQVRIDVAIKKAWKLMWEGGLLRREPSFCHGITGNAFAFPPGKEKDHFLAHTTEDRVRNRLADGTFQTSNYGRQHSLGIGEVGGAVGWLWRDRNGGTIVSYNDVQGSAFACVVFY
jgi:hypothetical protein